MADELKLHDSSGEEARLTLDDLLAWGQHLEKCLREFLREGGPRVSIPTEVLLQYATMANGALARLKNEPKPKKGGQGGRPAGNSTGDQVIRLRQAGVEEEEAIRTVVESKPHYTEKGVRISYNTALKKLNESPQHSQKTPSGFSVDHKKPPR
jgi:hypothetical protein